MPISKPKATEYKIDELTVKDFCDERFVKLLEDNIENIKFEHICLKILGKKEGEEKESVIERLIIGHEVLEDEKKKITTIGATKPETCETLLNMITEYITQKEKSE